MDFVKISVPDSKRSSIFLRHFKKINLLLFSTWADQMKFLISFDYQITGTSIYAEGYYQTAVGDLSTKIYLRAKILEFKENVIRFNGTVEIQPGFGLTSLLNTTFSGDGRINVADMGNNIYRVTDFYMETGSDKLELDSGA
jgi:hypothetical protein